jgi:hypothetical protein
MTSRACKAVAAMIVAGVAIGIYQYTGSFDGANVAYGMTDVPGLYKNARVIHLQGWLHYNLTDKGKKVPKVPLERWIDQENGRIRFTQPSVYADPERVTITMREVIANGQYKMVLNHTDKKAVFYRISDYQRMLQTHHGVQDMFGHLFGNVEIFEDFVKTGREEIDGVTYDVWVCDVKKPDSTISRIDRYKYWLSPATGESGRFQSWYKNGEEPWRLGHDYYKIERDVEIQKDTFALVVPKGYEASNTRETAIPLELDEMGGVGHESLRLDPRISFTMSDGSVVLGWRSVDAESATSQIELFEGLEFGGNLPRVPVEIRALKPSGWPGDTAYIGRHLAHTQKGDMWIEWSLYVPDGLPPKRSEMLDYDVLCGFNPEQQIDHWPSTSVDYGIRIETEEDFNKWVLGAMAELNDEGRSPKQVTYEKVLQLAKEIRDSRGK